ncbi:CoA pyrophosphatase [Sapientia aquatica]|uniref:CoA pyrophosphatase n=1 Tax=Sapientia aquatica TaxID=1549640 RepID=UPI001D0DA905|nr:CoA pyrophosphatase [Sapientia aquatica]
MTTAIFDPIAVPIDSISDDGNVETERLEIDWIRSRFAHPPQWRPEITDESSLMLDAPGFVDAAVLITLVQREAGLHVLFTRRTAHLKHHAGQISFPGGRTEKSDLDVIQAALREAREEIGLDSATVDVLGTLPDYYTGTGYRVTPVVAALVSSPSLQSEINEVAEIFEVPLAFLMDGSNHQLRSAIFPKQGARRSFYSIPYNDYFIWGATAGMLRNLFHFLRA